MLPLAITGAFLVAAAVTLVCWTTLAAPLWTSAVREAPLGRVITALWTFAPLACAVGLLVPRTTRASAATLALVLLAGLGVAVVEYAAPAPIVIVLFAVAVTIGYTRLDRPTRQAG